MPAAGITGGASVRPFSLDDLDAAARFCDTARELDPLIEPFGPRLRRVATGPRAELALWRIAQGQHREIQGIAFAAARESSLFDFYVAVHPPMRRLGLGRALSAPALSSGAALRGRVPEEAAPGRAFLRRLGFAETGGELSLRWTGRSGTPADGGPRFEIRLGSIRDGPVLQRLSERAWRGTREAFSSRPGDQGQLFARDRIVLVAESDGAACGLLCASPLGDTLAIEEVAVLPELRRRGIARALLVAALAKQTSCVLNVSESNRAARALYRSFGFREGRRRIVVERRG